MIDAPQPESKLPSRILAYSSMRVLVSGASGFLGYHLTKRLVELGCNVSVVVRKGSNRKRLESLSPAPAMYEHDGTTEQLVEIVKKISPETVFHLAAAVMSEHKPDDIEPLIASNILFGAQLVEAAVQSKTARFINTGTFWQHYQGSDYDPVSLYAATKKAFDDILAYYLNATALTGLTLELSDTYGPCDDRNKLFNQLRRTAPGNTFVLSPGGQQVGLVHAYDVVNAYLYADHLLRENPELSGKCYAVTALDMHTLREIVELFVKTESLDVSLDWGGRPYRQREIMYPYHGEILPGWKPEIPFEVGVRSLIKDDAKATGATDATK
jgi:nucleoside-diphosphate-sugar epimerase